MNALRFILQNLGPFRRRFLLLLCSAAIDGVVLFSIPLILAELTRGTFTVEQWTRIVPVLVSCMAASIAMQWLVRRYGEAMGRHYTNHLQLHYFRLVEQQEVSVLQKHHSGYILSLVSRVTGNAGSLAVSLIWLSAHIVVVTTLFFIFTARESVPIALLNLVLMVVFLLVSLWFSARMVPLLAELNVASARAGQRFVDVMGNILTVKRLRLRRFAFQHLQTALDVVDKQVKTVQLFHANRWATLHSIFAMAFLGTISFLLWRISHGATSAAVLVLFISAYATLRGYVERLSEMMKDLLELGGYISTLSEILTPVQPHALLGCGKEWQTISAHNVSFTYPDSGITLSIPEFTLSKGEIICITGESGQGKSTLLALIAHLLRAHTGALSLDGTPYSESEEYLDQLFAITSQEVDLFAMNIRENLRLGRSIPDAQLIEVLDSLALVPWLNALPQGLDSEIGERGVRLSAGQRQRINLARALLLDREILLLDEPTSHLDRTTERLVVDALRRVVVGKTAVIVTHREAVLSLATRRYEVCQGTVYPRSGKTH
jgi:ABC-type bacteriocin/lantibiotic exporter with double-glycine peptidase domain